MSQYLSMGGYGAYVWPAYALSAVTLIGLTAYIVRRSRAAQRRLANLEKRDG